MAALFLCPISSPKPVVIAGARGTRSPIPSQSTNLTANAARVLFRTAWWSIRPEWQRAKLA